MAADHMFGIQECGKCRYAKVDNPLLKSAPVQCRRHPPQVVIVPVPGPSGSVGMSAQAVWPSMQRTEGCGDGLPIAMLREVAPTGESSPVKFGQINGGES